MAKKQVNRVGFLLDETGSMGSRREETIKAVNEYFKSLRANNALVTFATFNTAQGINFREIETKAANITDLTLETYKPNASTPLYDAIGKMIGKITDQAGSKDKVLIVVVTDGEENASQEFDLTRIKELVATCEKKKWAFAYVGAAPDAWSGAGALGVVTDNILNVSGTKGTVSASLLVNALATDDYFSGRVSHRALYSHSRHTLKGK